MKFKIMAGTISIIVMLTTPTLAQAQVASYRTRVPLASQSPIVGIRAKTLGVDIIGLNDDEIRIKLKMAGQAKQLATHQARAEALNIDITGLTIDQARIKIKAEDRKNTLTNILAQAKTLGIGVEVIKKDGG